MNEYSDALAQGAAGLVSAEADLEREFESRLADSSTLAFRVAYSIVRNREDAEDVAQEAFVRAHRGFRRLRERRYFRTWLVRITWRLAIDRRRADMRRHAREEGSLDAGSAAATEEQAILARERSAGLWRAIDALPPKLRVVLVLAAIEEQSVREVADLLGLPDGTVKSRLFLARKRLQEQLR